MTSKFPTTQVLSSEEMYRAHYFRVLLEKYRLPNGQQLERSIVAHPGAAVIVPQCSNGDLLMVQQYRHAIRGSLLEFPAGTMEQSEAPLACAQREIVEEVGHSAEEWISLGLLHPAPGFCNEAQHCFLARMLVPKQAAMDEDEIIEVRRISPAALEAEISAGKLTDAKTLAVFLLLRLRGMI
jgi:ADP-ribose pyrophosphatase